MQKEDAYTLLEEKFLTYRDLKSIPVVEDGTPLVPLTDYGVSFTLIDGLVAASTGMEIFVREVVAQKLKQAQTYLDDLLSDYTLDVVYGYRSWEVQTTSYLKIKEELLKKHPDVISEEDLNEIIHRFIAVPDVAGHPTGGAVDVRILDKSGKELDMGTKAHDFIKESYTFSPFVSKEVWANRQKLRHVMLSAGFAPFDGEWWHFSYGDREWAAYYGKPNAIYDQLEMQNN